MPLSLSIRFFTESLLIMVPTLAYLPTSLKKLNRPMPPNQSRLLTTIIRPSLEESKRRSVASIPRVFVSIVSSLITGRSADFPDGSPTRPVAPPSRATGV